MQTLIEKLNTPFAVIAVLAVIIIANGFLIYQVRSPDEPANEQAASQNEQAAQTTEPENSAGSGSTTRNEAEEEETPPTEETTEQEVAEETEPAEVEEETTEQEVAEATEETESVEEAEVEETEPVQEATPTLLAGLSGSVSECRESAEDDEECIRDFVTEVAPDSRYVGGRIDLAAQTEEINTEIIYFEDPGLAPCEFERAEYDGEGNRYAVILVGEGSFSDARGDQCIPQA